jgi:hypothetical protein
LCLCGKILSFQAFVGFTDKELQRAGFEAEADPLPDAEFKVEGKVPAFAGAPQAREFTQEPAVVDYLQHRQTRAFDERFDVPVEQLFGCCRDCPIQGVFRPGADFSENPVNVRAQCHGLEQTFHTFHTTTPFAGFPGG